MRIRSLRSLALGLLLGASACSDAFPSPEVVEKNRVLAGRVVIDGDPARVTPMPGETASYQLLVGGPDAQVSWSYMLGVCRLVRDGNGSPYCDPELPLLSFTGTEPLHATPPTQLPFVTFTVPALENLREDEAELLLTGIVCPGGELDPKLLLALAAGDISPLAEGRNPCAEKNRNGLVLAAPIPFERSPESRNHAPLIEKIGWSKVMKGETKLLGTEWTERAASDDGAKGCKDKAYPQVSVKDKLGFQFQLDAAARETYLDPSPIPGEAARERIEIPEVHGYASAGEFTIVRDHQQKAQQILQLEWHLPDHEPAPEGLLVRYWFLAQDDRSYDDQATSYEERALCVLP